MNDNDKNVNLRLDFPFHGGRIGFWSGILLACLVVGAVLVWIYLFSIGDEQSSKILWMELIVNLIILVFNLYLICRVGYDDQYLQNLKVTYTISTVLSVIGFYIGKIEILAKPVEGNPTTIYYFMQFIVYLLLSALMALIPAAAICLLMWLIMKIFGRPSGR